MHTQPSILHFRFTDFEDGFHLIRLSGKGFTVGYEALAPIQDTVVLEIYASINLC